MASPTGIEWTETTWNQRAEAGAQIVDRPLVPERGALLPRHAAQIAGREHDLVALELVASSGLQALGILEARAERLGADRSSGTLQAFAAVGITTTKSGEPCYGCEGSPVAFWVWRPPATA